jgi:predicted protein tyrosine phosphatase
VKPKSLLTDIQALLGFLDAGLKGVRVVRLDIRDDYALMQPELVALLEKKVARFL